MRVDHQVFMKEALAEAQIASKEGNWPMGCVVVLNNAVIARAHNIGYTDKNRLAHAEIQPLKNQPVAVATLTNYRSLGYVSNVGSLPEVRGQGFGKTITNACIHKSLQNNNDTHFFVTEEGTNPHNFYLSLGFEHRFSALLFEKTNNA